MSSKELPFREGLALVAVAVLFVVSALAVRGYEEPLRVFLEQGGMLAPLAYVAILALGVVVAPISATPLVPVASILWGIPQSATLSVVGWGIGAAIAFWLARKVGRPLISRVVSLESIHRYERLLPEDHVFWTLVLLRIALPVDILSYAVGLFSTISFQLYLTATMVGIIPFAIILAWAGTLPLLPQLAIFAVAAGAALVYVYFSKREN